MNQSTPTLSIGIPTYNRPEALCRRLVEIDKFTDFIQEVVICDNSPVTSNILTTTIKSITYKCNYIKNVANIGGGANFLRVVENATTDYVWWRGDDDVISDVQVDAVITSLSSTPKLILLCTTITNPLYGQGIEDFVDSFNEVETMCWFSTIVLPVEIAKKALPWGYSGISTGWANVTLVLGLFRACPNLEFVVTPIVLKSGEFRDAGREVMWWALFETTLKQFPKTASIIISKNIRKKYISNWRETRKFSLMRPMAGMRLGFTAQERPNFMTFWSLVSLKNLRTTLLAVVLYLMLVTPKILYQIAFSLYWLRLSEEEKKNLHLDFLMQYSNFRDVFKELRRLEPGKLVGTFL